MNKSDHAIIVGIRDYPGISHLNGPLNDAEDFRAWLKSAEGGNIDPDNIYEEPKYYTKEELDDLDVLDALPNKDDIKRLFDKLNRLARKARNAFNVQQLEDENIKYYHDPDDNMLYYGRRLYLFFAGHGFNDKAVKTSVSLLAANGDYERLINNGVNAFHCLEFYEKSGYFKEVVLITDCCRVPRTGDDITKILLDDPANPVREVRTIYMLSCQDGQKAREAEYNGRYNGAFSKLILAAFNEAKSDHALNAVTIFQIKSYIENNKDRLIGNQVPVIHGNEYYDKIKLIKRTDEFTNIFPIKFKFPPIWVGGIISISTTENKVLLNDIKIESTNHTFDLPLEILKFKIRYNDEIKEIHKDIVSSKIEIDFEN